MKMVIIGSGVSGIMAARYFAKYSPLIIEKEGEIAGLGNNFASTRVKSEEIGLLLNTSTKKVSVSKQIFYKGELYDKPSIKLRNMYSYKVIGKLDKRSIEFGEGECVRYFFTEPIQASGLNVRYNTKFLGAKGEKLFVEDVISKDKIPYDVCISTIPMPDMFIGIWGDWPYRGNLFKVNPIYVTEVTFNIQSSVYQTIYFPDCELKAYRASLEADRMLIESTAVLFGSDVKEVIKAFGLQNIEILSTETKQQKAGKISNIDDTQRKSNILYLTENYNIYSLGRFAIWKNGVEMDDVYSDLKKIERMINIKNKEERKYEGRID